jgi:hypothetical protein
MRVPYAQQIPAVNVPKCHQISNFTAANISE